MAEVDATNVNLVEFKFYCQRVVVVSLFKRASGPKRIVSVKILLIIIPAGLSRYFRVTEYMWAV